jgi:CBS domain-containing protein
MDITDIVSTDYVEFTGDTPASKLAGAFDDPTVKGVVVTDERAYEGVVTRRQLARTHHPPDTKVRSLVWHVPTVSPREDVRAVAQLMLDSDARLLPVFEGDSMPGVVTADDLLGAVEPHLAAVTVEDVYTDELYTVTPDASVAEPSTRSGSGGSRTFQSSMRWSASDSSVSRTSST